MAPTNRATLRPFTPSREAPEALVERTVGRDELLAAIHGRLRAAATTGNRSHTLVVGARGSGKTHVLDVALHGLLNDDELSSRLAVGRVDEDVVGIVTYADLLLQLLASLKPPADVLNQARASRDVAAIEAAIIDQLGDRVLVAVVENLSKVFDTLGTPGQRNLRSFVETTGQVVLLASTPLLFQAVGSRNEPWFGSFAIEHLPELTLDEGIEVIRRLADQDGDDRFVAFLDSPKGRARLAALHHLAGGSPRLWMILAGCATVELLDDLVPAVETLLENLVAYYQQRLWDLPGNEQKLVRELGTGPPSASVGDLAALCGLDERTAATALGRLVESGWVRREKLAGADQRKSWYRLREPLLRHHFQYRQADGEPLRLIVDILRTWFDPMERRLHLAGVPPTSVAERRVVATFALDPPERSDQSYFDRNIDRLLAEARSWMIDADAIGTRGAGILVEAAINALRSTPEEVQQVLVDREASPSVFSRAQRLFIAIGELDPDKPIEDRVGSVLDIVARESIGSPDHRVLELVAACWNGAADPTNALKRLQALEDASGSDRLTLTIADEYGFWLGEAGRHDEAVDAFTSVIEARVHFLGPDHRDTLVTRHNLAYVLGQMGRHEDAVAAFMAVAEDRTRVLGSDHPDALLVRRGLAVALILAGRHKEAVDALIGLVEDSVSSLGAAHPDTLSARLCLASTLDAAGRQDEAVRVAVLSFEYENANWNEEDSAASPAAATLLSILIGVLRAGGHLPPAEGLGPFASSEEFRFLQDFEAAKNGSPGAAARLPTELRSLAERIFPGTIR